MNISVVICVYTQRRWEDILAAVASVRAQRHAPHEIILVVDHNPELRDRLAAQLRDLVVVPNTHARGLSGGKNTGVAAASGEAVAFLDDDAVAAPGWLAAFAKHYEDPAVLGVGGRTLALWPGSPAAAELLDPAHPLLNAAVPAESGRRPEWFPAEFDWTVGCTYAGMTPGPIRNLMGGNSSFRREAFAVAGGFAEGIGRSFHRRPLGCEETEFCIRLRQRSPGAELVYDPDAVIWHRVPPERARFAYFRRRCYAEGLSKALVTRSVGVHDGLASERVHALRTLPRGVRRGLVQAVRGEPAGLRRAAAITVGLAWTAWGYAVGTATVRRPPRRRTVPTEVRR